MFSELRRELDEAITYGCFDIAARLAHKGQEQARQSQLPGEFEYFIGQIDIINGDYEEAISHFDKAIEYNPFDGAAFNDRALCMVELGIIDEALHYFDKGIEVEPDYATIYHNKGWLLNKIGRHSEAIENFQKALELEPKRAVTYENLADAFANLCDYKAALSAYRKAISLLKPNYSGIKEQIVAQIKLIEEKNAEVIIHDPYVRPEEVERVQHDFDGSVTDVDAILIVTNHKEYYDIDLDKLKNLMRKPVIIDGRNVFNAQDCKNHGFIYFGVGKGV